MAVRHLTLRQLEIFRELVNHMNITRTAEALHLTPSAVSIQMRQLAEAAGMPLFEQVGKKLYLTDAGRAMALTSRGIFEHLERLQQELGEIQGLERGRLRLGIITAAIYFIPRVLGAFSHAHPGIEVSLYAGNRRAILERLATNQDDLHILGQPPEEMNVTATAFAPNPLIVVAHPDHPLAGRKRVPPPALAEQPFIMREQGSGTRRTCEDFLAGHGVTLKVRMELSNDEAIKQAVGGRLGLAFQPESNVHKELLNGELARIDVRGMPLKRQWYVVHPADKKLGPAATAFRDYLIEAMADVAPLSG
ncbi:MAG TPA: LysR family transcriptional regulator [Thermopetrobacter sp.]|nr:LysR family transcriptional regulator [Thermopetrobacter sp.]